MFYHHTKNKGDLAVLKAKCDLHEKGFLVLNPETEHAPFDIVIYKDFQFKRIQVKYRELNNGCIELQFRSNYISKGKPVSTPVDKKQIDLYCVYCKNTDICYYLNPRDFNKSVRLRVKPAKNNQKKGIKYVEDYCIKF